MKTTTSRLMTARCKTEGRRPCHHVLNVDARSEKSTMHSWGGSTSLGHWCRCSLHIGLAPPTLFWHWANSASVSNIFCGEINDIHAHNVCVVMERTRSHIRGRGIKPDCMHSSVSRASPGATTTPTPGASPRWTRWARRAATGTGTGTASMILSIGWTCGG